jgi:hypothetical protein
MRVAPARTSGSAASEATSKTWTRPWTNSTPRKTIRITPSLAARPTIRLTAVALRRLRSRFEWAPLPRRPLSVRQRPLAITVPRSSEGTTVGNSAKEIGVPVYCGGVSALLPGGLQLRRRPELHELNQVPCRGRARTSAASPSTPPGRRPGGRRREGGSSSPRSGRPAARPRAPHSYATSRAAEADGTGRRRARAR